MTNFQTHTITLTIFTRVIVEKRTYWPEGQQYMVILDDDHRRGNKVLARRCSKEQAQLKREKTL